MKAWTTGNVAGTGTFRCTDCDYPVSLDAVDELPTCPNCGGKEFVRASLFSTVLVAFELTAPLLLVGVVGAVVIWRRHEPRPRTARPAQISEPRRVVLHR